MAIHGMEIRTIRRRRIVLRCRRREYNPLYDFTIYADKPRTEIRFYLIRLFFTGDNSIYASLLAVKYNLTAMSDSLRTIPQQLWRCARGRTRTGTSSLTADFESAASTNFATRAEDRTHDHVIRGLILSSLQSREFGVLIRKILKINPYPIRKMQILTG